MKLKTTSRQTASAIPAETHVATLTGAKLHIATEFQSDARYQAIELSWSIQGYRQPFTEKFVRFTLHEKSTLSNRIGALMGRAVRPDDEIEWDVSDDAQTGLEVDIYDRHTKAVERTTRDGIIGSVEDIVFDGESILGRSCFLALAQNESGHNRAGANAATAMPKHMQRSSASGAGQTMAPNALDDWDDDDERG